MSTRAWIGRRPIRGAGSRALARTAASLALAGALSVAGPPAAARAQSLVERPPDLDVSWVAQPGTIQFDFLHRFITGGGDQNKVINSPTFLIGLGLPGRLMAGFNYATNSTLVAAYPNEWEYFGRWLPLSEDLGAPVNGALQGGYNMAARSFDAAASLSREFGPIRLAIEPRFFSHAFDTAQSHVALAGGAVLRLNRWLGLAGDVGKILGSGDYRTAWGAGIQLAIPYTPHTLSIQTTNTTTGTLEGASLGTGTRRYGFAFTIPFTLARYFGHAGATTTASAGGGAAATGGAAGAAPAAAARDSGGAATPAAAPQAAPAPQATPAPPAATAPAAAAAPAVRDSTASTTTPRSGNAAAAGNRAPARSAPASAPTPARAARPAGATIVIHNLAYNPGAVSIAAGGAVTWTNKDAVPHSVTADDGSFDSGLIQPGSSFSHTFSAAGHVAFHCTPHPFMHGSVTVK